MKILNNTSGLLAVTAYTCLLFACGSSSDYKNDNDSTSKQNAVIEQSNVDTNAMKNDGSQPAMANDTSSSKTTKTVMAQPNPAKKGHKGTIRMAVYKPGAKDKMEADKEGVYNYAEIRPMFPGGENELEKFVQDNIKYPQDATDNGVEGTVTVIFAVDETGKVYAPKLKDEKLGYGLDDEAIAVIKKMPRWTPGRIKGKNVKTYYNLPITFSLL